MDLSSSSATIPCVSITQADGAVIRTNSTPVFAEGSETVWYYTGKMQVATEVATSPIPWAETSSPKIFLKISATPG